MQKECGHCSILFTSVKKTTKFCCHNCSQKSRYQRLKGLGKIAEYQYRAYAKKVYGLTIDAIEEMHKEQNNSCAICETHLSVLAHKSFKKKLCVDHCHTTGIVRGLLCTSCNTMLGMAKDNINILNRAVAYLERNKA